MQKLRSIPELASVSGPVFLSVGVFDGLHLGHRAVIRASIDAARRAGGSAVAVTFDPHPAKILRPDHAPRLLTSTPHKIRLMEDLDLDGILVVTFDRNFANSSPVQFVEQLASACKPLRGISVGPGWTFGRGRAGTIDFLRSEGGRLGFGVTELCPVTVDDDPVSSTRIRNAIYTGDLDQARSCLGRDYAILGTVERGRQLGRTLGFPTANLRAHNEQFPPDGVYAVTTSIDSNLVTGIANIGFRPTINGTGKTERILEAHFFDFEGNLYGRDLELTFVKFLRPEIRFPGLPELKARIAKDAAEARSLFSLQL